jgi:prolyl oligopeptidase
MKRNFGILVTILISVQPLLSQSIKPIRNWEYPEINTDSSIEYYFNKKVIDPYQNLENIENIKFSPWIEKQNKMYDTIIHSITAYKRLEKEMDEIIKIKNKWIYFPRIVGNRFFYGYGFFNDSDIERLGYSDSYLNIETIEIFNTKAINNEDHCVYSIDYYEPSPNGKYIAFGISPNGSEKASILVLDVESKEILPEKIQYSHAGNIQWLTNCAGFFYMKDKEIKTGEDINTFYEDAKVMYHSLFNDTKADKEIFSRLLNSDLGLEKVSWPRLFIFPSSDYVILNYIKDSYYIIYFATLSDLLNKPAKNIIWNSACCEDDKMSTNIVYNDKLIGISFKDNPNGQLISMNLSKTEHSIIYESSKVVLDDLILTQNGMFLTTMESGFNKLLKINPKNIKLDSIELPFLGGLRMIPYFPVVSAYQASDNLFFTLVAYNKQLGGYVCDENNKVTRTNFYPEFQYTNPPIELVQMEVEVPSYDGIMVPLSIVYKNDITLDSANPTIIEAYGAFGESLKPEFLKNRLIWFNHGGIYAVAHVRGGYEKGDNWYKGGFKATKPNSWKDLIACSEYLINKKYTSPKNLAAVGYSAGGITIGRAITDRPDLFKAAVIYVGILNTIRLENTFNPQVAEFGTVKDSMEFQYLYEMDTYHHIQEDVNYPSVLFTAGLNDSRVAPWQPAKAVAKMQEVSNGSNIILFRVADKGHFDYPSDAEVYAFLFWQLGHPDFKLNTDSTP